MTRLAGLNTVSWFHWLEQTIWISATIASVAWWYVIQLTTRKLTRHLSHGQSRYLQNRLRQTGGVLSYSLLPMLVLGSMILISNYQFITTIIETSLQEMRDSAIIFGVIVTLMSVAFASVQIIFECREKPTEPESSEIPNWWHSDHY